jgi:hypothetical protein
MLGKTLLLIFVYAAIKIIGISFEEILFEQIWLDLKEK